MRPPTKPSRASYNDPSGKIKPKGMRAMRIPCGPFSGKKGLQSVEIVKCMGNGIGGRFGVAPAPWGGEEGGSDAALPPIGEGNVRAGPEAP